MPAATERVLLEGASGKIEVAYTLPEGPNAIAVIAHPHPLFGGTMDNKVVTRSPAHFQRAARRPFASISAVSAPPGARTTRAAARPTTCCA